jgi:hypothetical protein
MAHCHPCNCCRAMTLCAGRCNRLDAQARHQEGILSMVRFINTIEGTINDSDLSAQIMAHLDRQARLSARHAPAPATA